MKKLISLLLVLSMSFALCACGAQKEDPVDPPKTNEKTDDKVPPVEPVSPETPKEEAPDPRLEQISVTAEYDTALSQAIVHISNLSDATFDGTVHVRFKNSENLTAGSDSIFVEDLTPGAKTYARMDLKSTDNLTMTHTISNDSTFTELPKSDITDVNAELSQKITDAFNGSFGYPGNEASWFSSIVKIEVFTNSVGGNNAAVTINTSDAAMADKIGNIVASNYRKDYSIAHVLVLDEAGTTLTTIS